MLLIRHGLLATHVQKQMRGLGNMHYNKPRLSWPYIISREHQCDPWEERYTTSDRQFDNQNRDESFVSITCLLCFEDSPPIGNVFLSLMSDYKPNKNLHVV